MRLIDEQVGRRLRIARHEMELSLFELSQKCKIAVGTIEKIESGYKRATPSQILDLVAALQIPLTKVFTSDET